MASKLKFDLTGQFSSFVGIEPETLGAATTGAGSFTGIDNAAAFHLVGHSTVADHNDMPFFAFMATEGQAIGLDIDNTTFDSQLTIVDGLGNVVAQNDDSGATDAGSATGHDPNLTFVTAKTGFYFAFVTSADNDYLGNFKFEGDGTKFGAFQLDLSVANLAPALHLGSDYDDYTDASNTDHNIFGDAGGDDIIFTGISNDIANGGVGDDHLNGGAGNDVLWGGAGWDQIGGFPGNDVIYGGKGPDTLQGGTGNDQIHGGDGNDSITGDVDDDWLWGGKGNDVIIPGLGNDHIVGGPGTDTLAFYFSPFAVTVDLRAGTSKIAGADSMAGRDHPQAGISFGEGTDFVSGIENIVGTSGDDQLTGSDGGNKIDGLNGNDEISGEKGSDNLLGGGDNDRISGDDGEDLISGGDGNDRLYGGDDNDVISGDDGDDYIAGGQGADVLTGGFGLDLFAFAPKNSPFDLLDELCDTITDFTQGVDRIFLPDFGKKTAFIGNGSFTHHREVGYFVIDQNTHIVADYNGDGMADFQVILTGAFSLLASDFIFDV